MVDSTHHDPHAGHGYTQDKTALLNRLRRIEGQVRGISRMVEDNTYCLDVLTQLASVNSALHKVSLELIKDHINHCVVDAAQESITTGDSTIVQNKVDEVTAAVGRLLR
ncbi:MULTISPECIES: metal-sensitive transcriptional regulator [unclassified Arthrobacter]|uniref:metal-sensitive transcriptional regulator n=1 Tax=unclassified Arthrobacter TaxID=235627 RepID=UPI0008A64F69|nr:MULTISPECIES: metal-sensitive transcriptional regulator [unclassified Arthrobacter]OFT22595.1 transcriptional regulator [Arthrobacter sp. HMSC08H08]OFT41402.1 transcriptional regulator [Arthrobacter sp. HMSC06H05]